MRSERDKLSGEVDTIAEYVMSIHKLNSENFKLRRDLIKAKKLLERYVEKDPYPHNIIMLKHETREFLKDE